MRCQEAERLWEEWLGGARLPELERHLESCSACRQQAAELARTAGWVRLLHEETPSPGPAFWARLRRRLEEEERAVEFGDALAWAAARVVLALAALVFLLGLTLLTVSSPAPAVADFDAPQTYLDESTGTALANGQLDRDQVVLTLVAYTEAEQ